jgi:hypothetical protein
VDKAYREKGLRIVGVSLDGASDPDRDAAEVRSEVRQFLIEHNVPWPNLLNGAGAQDYAGAFGVREIPANVLIGRDGRVVHLDLTASNLERVVQQALGE